MKRLKRVNTYLAQELKSDAEYVKTVNNVQIWSCPNGFRLFAERKGDTFYAGAFYPLSQAEEQARNE